MYRHLQKHLIHGLFLLAMLVAVTASDVSIGALGIVATVVVSLVTLEGGLWAIDRRDQRRELAS